MSRNNSNTTHRTPLPPKLRSTPANFKLRHYPAGGWYPDSGRALAQGAAPELLHCAPEGGRSSRHRPPTGIATELTHLTLAIFDLDNTLIGGDSDHLWGEFVVEAGIVDDGDFAARNASFYRDYERGELDIEAYLRFALSPLRGRSREEAAGWHRRFMREKIEPIMLPAAARLLHSHRERGHTLLIVTATNEFITRPIADALAVEHLLACEAELVDEVYTGVPLGVPTYREGKVTRLRQWLDARGEELDGAWCYSDSHNDLPLLEAVDNPVAVDPDDTLRARARERGWPVITLRGESTSGS